MFLKMNQFPQDKKVGSCFAHFRFGFTVQCLRFLTTIKYVALVFDGHACKNVRFQVYVIGGEGILEELKLAGYTGLGGPVSS